MRIYGPVTVCSLELLVEFTIVVINSYKFDNNIFCHSCYENSMKANYQQHVQL